MCILRNILLFLSGCFLIFGCSNDQDIGLTTITIANKTDKPLPLSQFANSSNKVHLETLQHILLGNIKDIKIYKDKIFITEVKKISIFDLEGKFIQFLGKRGQGPGEYGSVTHLDIDIKSGNIYVSAYNKLMVFDSNYELIEEKKLDYHLNYFKIFEGNLWVVSEEIGIKVGDKFVNQTNIYRLDDSYRTTDTIPFRTIILDNVHIGGSGFRYWLSDIEEGLFMFMPVLTPENMIRDTLYQVKDNIVMPAVKFQFERKQSLNESGYQTLLLINIFNSTSYYILEYDQDWNRFMFLYSKKEKRGYNLSEGLLDEDGDAVFLRPLDLEQDLFYYIKQYEFEDKNIEEKNPIIGIVKLK